MKTNNISKDKIFKICVKAMLFAIVIGLLVGLINKGLSRMLGFSFPPLVVGVFAGTIIGIFVGLQVRKMNN